MKCPLCKKRIKPGQPLLRLRELIHNENRGDFFADKPEHMHIVCVMAGTWSREQSRL